MPDCSNLFDPERRRLSKAVNKAALELLRRHGYTGFRLAIPHTDPPLYVIAGSAEAIQRLAAETKPKADPDCLDSSEFRRPGPT